MLVHYEGKKKKKKKYRTDFSYDYGSVNCVTLF